MYIQGVHNSLQVTRSLIIAANEQAASTCLSRGQVVQKTYSSSLCNTSSGIDFERI